MQQQYEQLAKQAYDLALTTKGALDRNNDVISRVATEIAVLSSQMDAMSKRLFGNGQPGELKVLEDRANHQAEQLKQDIETELNTLHGYVDDLRKMRWQLVSAVAVIMFVLNFIGFTALYTMVRSQQTTHTEQEHPVHPVHPVHSPDKKKPIDSKENH